MAYYMHQFVYYGIVMVENSAYFLGTYIFSHMLGPLMDNMMNDYRFHI